MWGENGMEAWKPIAQIQQMERMVHIHNKEDSHSHVAKVHFVRAVLQWKNVPWWFFAILFPQTVHILNSLDSNCTPDLLIPDHSPTGNDCFLFFSTSSLTASTEILFPRRLWTQQWQSCAVSWSVENTCVVSSSSSQLPPPAQTPRASSVKPGYVSEH